MEPLRVLFVEDSPDDVDLVLRELKRSGFAPEHKRVDAADSLGKVLSDASWDIVLCDFNMPGFNAAAALNIVKRHDPLLPFIVVSGSVGEATAVEMMKCGAHDYLMKNNIARLPEVVRREIRDALRHREMQATQAALRTKEEQLRQAQKLEAIGRLAGGIAHDFNNILTVVIGRCKLLTMKMPNQDPVRKELEVVLDAVWRASDLTRQLLAFSRQQVLQPKVIDPNAVVRETEKMLRRLIGEDIDFIVRLDPDAGRVLADPGQMTQILLNLVVNARDAMPGGGKLIVETGQVKVAANPQTAGGPKPGEYALITVTDSGTGMRQEVLERVFEPFFTTKEPGKGTGLGLSVVYGIVQQSQGHVDVHSTPGKGACFRIYLPLVDAPVERLARDSGPAEAVRDGGTILVVEDEEQVRCLVCETLQSYGYKVLSAAHAPAALEIFNANPQAMDLLLTDLVMPQMNGIDLATKLRERRPDLRVVFMSGYTEHAALQQGSRLAGSLFLQKPFTPDSLLRKLRSMLQPSAPGGNGANESGRFT